MDNIENAPVIDDTNGATCGVNFTQSFENFLKSTVEVSISRTSEPIFRQKSKKKHKQTICDICGKVFANGTNCYIHQKNVHATEKKKLGKECPNCHKIIYHTFENHLRKCTVEESKPTCTVCNSAFKTKITLKRHMNQVHLRKSTVKCPECPAVFGRKQNLTKHINLVHRSGVDTFQCMKCGGMYADLYPHYTQRHPDAEEHKKEKCKCGKYVYSYNMNSHMKNSHTSKCPICLEEVTVWEIMEHLNITHSLWPLTKNRSLIMKALENLKLNTSNKKPEYVLNVIKDKNSIENILECETASNMKDFQAIKINISEDEYDKITSIHFTNNKPTTKNNEHCTIESEEQMPLNDQNVPDRLEVLAEKSYEQENVTNNTIPKIQSDKNQPVLKEKSSTNLYDLDNILDSFLEENGSILEANTSLDFNESMFDDIKSYHQNPALNPPKCKTNIAISRSGQKEQNLLKELNHHCDNEVQSKMPRLHTGNELQLRDPTSSNILMDQFNFGSLDDCTFIDKSFQDKITSAVVESTVSKFRQCNDYEEKSFSEVVSTNIENISGNVANLTDFNIEREQCADEEYFLIEMEAPSNNKQVNILCCSNYQEPIPIPEGNEIIIHQLVDANIDNLENEKISSKEKLMRQSTETDVASQLRATKADLRRETVTHEVDNPDNLEKVLALNCYEHEVTLENTNDKTLVVKEQTVNFDIAAYFSSMKEDIIGEPSRYRLISSKLSQNNSDNCKNNYVESISDVIAKTGSENIMNNEKIQLLKEIPICGDQNTPKDVTNNPTESTHISLNPDLNSSFSSIGNHILRLADNDLSDLRCQCDESISDSLDSIRTLDLVPLRDSSSPLHPGNSEKQSTEDITKNKVQWYCFKCKINFQSRKTYQSHVNANHPEINIKPGRKQFCKVCGKYVYESASCTHYKCGKCGEHFDFFSAQKSHQFTCVQTNIKCQNCQIILPRKRDYYSHLVEFHPSVFLSASHP